MDSHERMLVLGSDSRIYTYDPERGTHSSFDFDLPGETSGYLDDCEDCLHNVPWLVTSVAGTVWVAYFQFQPAPDEYVFETKPNRIRVFGSDGTWREEFEFDSEGTVSEASIAAIQFDSSRFV
jgi:hypothetical protein